jgi:hypothetical protein
MDNETTTLNFIYIQYLTRRAISIETKLAYLLGQTLVSLLVSSRIILSS